MNLDLSRFFRREASVPAVLPDPGMELAEMAGFVSQASLIDGVMPLSRKPDDAESALGATLKRMLPENLENAARMAWANPVLG